MKLVQIIFFIAFMQTLSSCQIAESETYLIPENFMGKVRIIFNQNGKTYKYRDWNKKDTFYTSKVGVSKSYENGRRIYKIPSDGILLTQFSENDGFYNRQYYSVDSDGKRSALKIFEFRHFKMDSAGYVVDDKNLRGIFGDGTDGSIGNEQIFYQEFVVAKYNILDKILSSLSSDEFNSKVEKTLGL